MGKRDTVPGTVNPFGFLAHKNLVETFAQFVEMPAGARLDQIYDYDSGKPLDEIAPGLRGWNQLTRLKQGW